MDSWPYGPRGHLRIQIQNHVGRLSISTHTLTPMQLHSTGVCIRAWYPPPPSHAPLTCSSMAASRPQLVRREERCGRPLLKTRARMMNWARATR